MPIVLKEIINTVNQNEKYEFTLKCISTPPVACLVALVDFKMHRGGKS